MKVFHRKVLGAPELSVQCRCHAAYLELGVHAPGADCTALIQAAPASGTAQVAHFAVPRPRAEGRVRHPRLDGVSPQRSEWLRHTS